MSMKIVTLKTYSRRFEDMSWTRLQDMSSKRLEDMSWSFVPDVLLTKKVFTGKESTPASNKAKSRFDKSLSKKLMSDKSKANTRQI